MDQVISRVAKVAPTNEFLLQGSIMEGSHDVLLHRLRGLCDNSDKPFETYTDHEITLSISMHIYLFANICMLFAYCCLLFCIVKNTWFVMYVNNM